jgi:hypothetical protein
MTDCSLVFALIFKTANIINDMAKVNIKSEKVAHLRRIFHTIALFSHYLSKKMKLKFRKQQLKFYSKECAFIR